VTGDGTNDVAALMAADVGLAMGKCGTEFAKEASDIVILDDDFGSIVKSVIWGRCIYNNVRRFLQFQLTANVSTLFISFVSAVVLRDTPFKAVQLLWVNMIMDSLGALALATGKPHRNLLDRRPMKKEMPIISGPMIRNIASQAILQILLIGVILVYPGDLPAYSQYHYTFLFNVFVLCQVFNLLNSRSTEPNESIVKGLMDTPLFFLILIGITFGQWFLVEIAGAFFSCTPLLMHEWIYSVGLASLSLPLGYVMRHMAPAAPPRGAPTDFTRKDDDEPLLNQSA
jgi:calcium-translocating P-type ATPase